MRPYNSYNDFLKTERTLFNSMSISACAANDFSNLSVLFGYPATISYTDSNEEKDMMTLFNWFLVSRFEEGKEPVKSGFITSEDEESAREYIARSLDDKLFKEYKDGDLYLVVTEVDSWEV